MALKKRSKGSSSSTNSNSNRTPSAAHRRQRRNEPDWGSWPFPFSFTLSHLLALLHTTYMACLSSLSSLERSVREYQMGLTDWLTSRQDGDEEGVERMAMLERSNEGQPSGRSASREGKEIKRRRHKPLERNLEEAVFFPGMVNLSGTLCYMNSVLQAFASVTSLFTQLEKIVQLAVDVDLPTPVTDALLEVLYDLNTPQKRQPPALRPVALLHALQTLPAIRRLLSTREQQDAHELFLVLAEAVSDEALKVAAEVAQSRGLGEILSLQGYVSDKGAGTVGHGKMGDGRKETREKKRGLAMPWEGLMARRRVCKTCGWCETIRMDTLGGLELAIPQSGDVTVEQCVAQYLAPELLSGVTCEMCSLRQTLHYYSLEGTRLSAPASTVSNGHAPTHHTKSGSFSALEHVLPNTNGIETEGSMSASRKKKAKEAKRVEGRLREMLDSGTVTHFAETTVPASSASGGGPVTVKWQTARTDSTREAAITRPPQSLRLHFIRSEYTPYGQLLKKNARVNFPLILDLTQFVANGVWEERNVLGMLNGASSSSASTSQSRVLYRLESVILHYGYNHSSGHYICIRRKPRPTPSDDAYRPVPISKSCPDGCGCDPCRWFGQVRGDTEVAGKGWLRISDADVDEVGVEELMAARSAVFMVFYEKVGECEGKGQVNGEEPKDTGNEEDESQASQHM